MPWYAIVALICLIIGPFDAFYLHIRAERRREALKRRREASEKPSEGAKGNGPGEPAAPEKTDGGGGSGE